MSEPLIHSHIEDGLPDEHPMAFTDQQCLVCEEPVHAFNNECMQPWVESGLGVFCLFCFALDPQTDAHWMPGTQEDGFKDRQEAALSRIEMALRKIRVRQGDA